MRPSKRVVTTTSHNRQHAASAAGRQQFNTPKTTVVDHCRTSPERLSIPPDRLAPPFKNRKFKILKPLPDDVTMGRVAPYFDQPGKGIQYHFPNGFSWYLQEGYIEEIP